MSIDNVEIQLQESVLSLLGKPVDCRAVFRDLAEAYSTDPFYLWTGCLSYMTAERGFYVYNAENAVWRPFTAESNIDSVRYTDLYDVATGATIERYGGLLQMLDIDGNVLMETETPLSLRDVQEVMSGDGTTVISYKGVLQYQGKDVSIASSMMVYENETLFPTTGEVTSLYLAKDTDTLYIWDDTNQEYKPINSTKTGIELITRTALTDGQDRFEIGANFNPLTDVVTLSKNGLDFPKEDFTVIEDGGVFYVQLQNGEGDRVAQDDEFVITAYRSIDMGTVNAANVTFNNTATDGTIIFETNPDDVQEALEYIGKVLEGLRGSAQYLGYFENDTSLQDWLNAGNIPPANGWVTVASSELPDHLGKKVKMIWDGTQFVYGGEIDEAMIVLDDETIDTNVVWSSAKINETFRRKDKPVPWSEVWDETTVELDVNGDPVLDAEGNPVPSLDGMLSERHKLHRLDDVDITKEQMNVADNPQNVGKVVMLGELGKFILGAGGGGTYIDTEGATTTVGGVSEGYATPPEGISVADLLYLMLHPVIPPKVEMKLEPTNDIIYETGFAIANPKVTSIYTQTSYPLERGRLDNMQSTTLAQYSRAVLLNRVNTHTHTHNITITNAYTWSSYIADNQGQSATETIAYKYGYKVFWGTLAKDQLDGATRMEDLEPILSKEILEPNSSFEKPYTGTVKYLCFAVPKDVWRPINRLRDVENGFYIDNNTFETKTLPYTLPDGTVIEYTLYVQDIICTVDNFIMLVTF